MEKIITQLHKSLFVDTGASAFIKSLPSFKMEAKYRFHLVDAKKKCRYLNICEHEQQNIFVTNINRTWKL